MSEELDLTATREEFEQWLDAYEEAYRQELKKQLDPEEPPATEEDA